MQWGAVGVVGKVGILGILGILGIVGILGYIWYRDILCIVSIVGSHYFGYSTVPSVGSGWRAVVAVHGQLTSGGNACMHLVRSAQLVADSARPSVMSVGERRLKQLDDGGAH